MKKKFDIKEINFAQLFEESKAVGINLVSINSDKTEIEVDSDKDITDLLNAHIAKPEPDLKKDFAAATTNTEKINILAKKSGLM